MQLTMFNCDHWLVVEPPSKRCLSINHPRNEKMVWHQLVRNQPFGSANTNWFMLSHTDVRISGYLRGTLWVVQNIMAQLWQCCNIEPQLETTKHQTNVIVRPCTSHIYNHKDIHNHLWRDPMPGIARISCSPVPSSQCPTWVVSHDDPWNQMSAEGIHHTHAPIANARIGVGPAQVVGHQHGDNKARPNASHVDFLAAQQGEPPWQFSSAVVKGIVPSPHESLNGTCSGYDSIKPALVEFQLWTQLYNHPALYPSF